jgi:predicted nuclease with RNAse H fold
LREAFVGIDVAFTRRKRLPICVCTWEEGRLTPLPLATRRDLKPPHGGGNLAALDPDEVAAFATAAADYLRALEEAERLRIVRIAIDAPSDPRHPERARRLAECAMDERRISCFATPSADDFERIRAKAIAHIRQGGQVSRIPHANQLWMLVGFELFRRLRKGRYHCIEVYPQATVAALRLSGEKKGSPAGYKAQLRAAAGHTGWPQGVLPELGSASFGSRHDKVDAYLAAWVAALPEEERIACGHPPNDVIWIPRAEPAPPEAPPPRQGSVRMSGS